MHRLTRRWSRPPNREPPCCRPWSRVVSLIVGHVVSPGGSARAPLGGSRARRVTAVWLKGDVGKKCSRNRHSIGGWVALLVAARLTEGVQALILGDPPLNIERFVAIESGEERISLWRTMRGLAGPGLSIAELASELADLPVSVPEQDKPIRCGDLPGMDTAHFRGWAKTLSQVILMWRSITPRVGYMSMWRTSI